MKAADPNASATSILSAASSADNDDDNIDQSGNEDDDILHRLGRSSFVHCGAFFLVVQTIIIILSIWYSWHIRNACIVIATIWILELWILLTCWKISLPHNDTVFLYRISSIMIILSTNPLLMPAPNKWRLRMVALFILYVFLVLMLLWAMECVATCLRKAVSNKMHLKWIVMDSLGLSVKAGLVLIYLYADAISGVGGRSFEEMICRREVFVALFRNQEVANFLSYADKIETEEIHEDFNDFLKALFAGFTLNIFLLFSFVSKYVCYMSFEDIMSLRITIMERILIGTETILIIGILVILGAVGKPHLSNDTIFNIFGIVYGISLFSALLLCGLISRSVSKGKHFYLEDRRRGTNNCVINNIQEHINHLL